MSAIVKENWLRGQDSNLRPSGYEPDELPAAPPRDWYKLDYILTGTKCQDPNVRHRVSLLKRKCDEKNYSNRACRQRPGNES